MLRSCVTYVILGVSLWISVADALFFHLNLADRKCFIEEVPDETKVLVWLKVEIYDTRTGGIMAPGQGLSMLVEARDSENRLIASKEFSTEGRIAFTSHIPGEHSVCMYANTTKWFSDSQLRVHFNIQTGENTVDYITLAKKERLTDLQLRVRQLLDQVEQITKEQNYQRYREERFRMTSESTNQRVLWWSVTQMVILVAMGAWQMRHLKSFFEAKKLV